MNTWIKNASTAKKSLIAIGVAVLLSLPTLNFATAGSHTGFCACPTGSEGETCFSDNCYPYLGYNGDCGSEDGSCGYIYPIYCQRIDIKICTDPIQN